MMKQHPMRLVGVLLALVGVGFAGCGGKKKDEEAGAKAAPAGASRKEQCEHHVREGLRGIALQTVILSESRDDASKRKAQSCILGESGEPHACLDEGERASLARYAEQRQRDCEAWAPELAACILKLPGASNCDPDTYPLWREPIQEGAAGPAIAWSVDVAESALREPQFDITEDGLLIVADATAVRGIRDGKVVWRTEPASASELWLAGRLAVMKGPEGGLVVLDVETGQQRGIALPDMELRAVGHAGDATLLALAEDGTLFRVTPAACKGRTPSCAAKLAALPGDDIPFEPSLSALGSRIVVATTEEIQVYDERGKRLFRMALRQHGAEFVAAVPPDHIAVIDDGGAAMLSPHACAKLGAELYLPSTIHLDPSMQTPREPPEGCDHCKLAGQGCVSAYRPSLLGDWQVPVPLPQAAIAFNDHGVVEKTHMLAHTGGWSVKTGGQGQVAGDEGHVYTVSFGHNSEGPVRLLALARGSGRTVWQSEVQGAALEIAEHNDVHVVAAGPWLAARISDRIFAWQLPR